MTPDAKTAVTSVESWKAVAPPPGPPLHAFITNKYRVTDGLVPDRNGKILAGPNAVIPPPASMTSAANATTATGGGR
jgi:hypothetical protein